MWEGAKICRKIGFEWSSDIGEVLDWAVLFSWLKLSLKTDPILKWKLQALNHLFWMHQKVETLFLRRKSQAVQCAHQRRQLCAGGCGGPCLHSKVD